MVHDDARDAEDLPAGQRVHDDAPDDERVPAGQLVHEVLREQPAPLCRPAGQLRQALQERPSI